MATLEKWHIDCFLARVQIIIHLALKHINDHVNDKNKKSASKTYDIYTASKIFSSEFAWLIAVEVVKFLYSNLNKILSCWYSKGISNLRLHLLPRYLQLEVYLRNLLVVLKRPLFQSFIKIAFSSSQKSFEM